MYTTLTVHSDTVAVTLHRRAVPPAPVFTAPRGSSSSTGLPFAFRGLAVPFAEAGEGSELLEDNTQCTLGLEPCERGSEVCRQDLPP